LGKSLVGRKRLSMRKGLLFIVLIGLFSCERWEETDGVSVVSTFPDIQLTGGEFQSFVKASIQEWEEPGYTAFVNGKEVDVEASDVEVNTDSVGLYFRFYAAQNSQQIQNTVFRTIAITHKPVKETDLSGIYQTVRFGSLMEMRVVKTHENGFYECEDILGFPGAEMPGKFADLGLGQLQITPGDGDFGAYASRTGTHTPNTLTFNIELLEEPNAGLILTVSWFRKDD